jgi:SOS response regulatory protein OraA/RecX
VGTNFLRQAYKAQLIQAGVDHHLAEQAAENLTAIELEMITEIWLSWSLTWKLLLQEAP